MQYRVCVVGVARVVNVSMNGRRVCACMSASMDCGVKPGCVQRVGVDMSILAAQYPCNLISLQHSMLAAQYPCNAVSLQRSIKPLCVYTAAQQLISYLYAGQAPSMPLHTLLLHASLLLGCGLVPVGIRCIPEPACGCGTSGGPVLLLQCWDPSCLTLSADRCSGVLV